MHAETDGMASIRQWLSGVRPMLIDGKWVAAADEATLDIVDPASEEIFAKVARASSADIDRAVEAARSAHERGVWRNMPPAQRAAILWKVADLIDAHAPELALLETLNNGKPLAVAKAVDIPFSAELFRYFSGWCTKIDGVTTTPSFPGTFHGYTRREPFGVVALIVPWNFPCVMASAKLAPALAAGCACVLKPAEQTPLTALKLGELLLEAGVPAGVVNIVPGLGSRAGATLVAHPGVDKIAFTGSTAVGKAIVRAAADNLPKVTLELGGKSPTIILEDADIEAAIKGAATSIFFNSGQVCVAGSRLFVARRHFGRVVEGIKHIAENLVVGAGLSPETEIGPLVSAEHFKRVKNYLALGIEEGAEKITGGSLEGKGYFVRPTILTNTRPDMRICREEIFGPVLVAEPFDDIDVVVKQANASEFGLAASVWTRDLKNAHKLAAVLQAGAVGVNCAGLSDPSLPFGGYKQSGWGREFGAEGLNAYLQTKSVIVALD